MKKKQLGNWQVNVFATVAGFLFVWPDTVSGLFMNQFGIQNIWA